MEALVIVDCQNDFCEEGSLAVTGVGSIFPSINALIETFAREGKPVFATKDWHPKGHVSFASAHEGHVVGDVVKNKAGNEQILWPDHCVQGEYGSEFDSRLNSAQIDTVILKGASLDTDSYSGFLDSDHVKSTGLADKLHEQGVDSIVVVGIALDYCIKSTVLDAIDAGFKTTIVMSACASMSDANIFAAQLEQAGTRVVATPEDL